MTATSYKKGQYIGCGTGSDSGMGCPGGIVEECKQCGKLFMDCPCGCSSFDFCECDNAPSDEEFSL